MLITFKIYSIMQFTELLFYSNVTLKRSLKICSSVLRRYQIPAELELCTLNTSSLFVIITFICIRYSELAGIKVAKRECLKGPSMWYFLVGMIVLSQMNIL